MRELDMGRAAQRGCPVGGGQRSPGVLSARALL